MTTYLDPFGGSTIQPAQVSYSAVALSANITLSWPQDSFSSGAPIFTRLTDVTPSGAGFSITLPDAREVSPGFDAFFANLGASSYTVKDAAGNTIATVTAGVRQYLYLVSNTTAAGTWRTFVMGVGTSTPDAASLAGLGLFVNGTTLRVGQTVTTTAVDPAPGFSDLSKTFVWTGGAGTLSLPALATAGSTWFVSVANQGTGVLTVDPNGAETIDGASSITLQPNESCVLHAGATSWYTVGRGRAVQFNISLLSKSVTGGSVVLTSGEASNVAQKYSGMLTSNCTVTLPSVVQVYYVRNDTTGSFSLTFTCGAGLQVAVAQGSSAILLTDGTNVYNMGGGSSSSSSTTLVREAKTANYTLVVADQGKLIDCTSGTFTLTFSAAAGLGSGWFVYIQNTGTGTVTLDPNGAELIDGVTTLTLYPQTFALVQCDGSALRTVNPQPTKLRKLKIFSSENSSFAAASNGEALVSALVDSTAGTSTVGSICYGSGLFVLALNISHGFVYTSPDGLTWTARTMPSSANWLVGCDGTNFMACVRSATTIAVSTDGITWTAGTALGGALGGTAMQPIKVGGLWIVGANGTTYYTSADGVAWVSRVLPGSPLNSSGGSLKLVGTTAWLRTAGTTAYTSTDAINWTVRTISNYYVHLVEDGSLVGYVDATTPVDRTTDGITWTSTGVFMPTTETNGDPYITLGGVRLYGFVSTFTVAAYTYHNGVWVRRGNTIGPVNTVGVSQTGSIGQASIHAGTGRAVLNGKFIDGSSLGADDLIIIDSASVFGLFTPA